MKKTSTIGPLVFRELAVAEKPITSTYREDTLEMQSERRKLLVGKSGKPVIAVNE